MGKIFIYGEEFYKGYSIDELLLIREDLNVIQAEIDSKNLEGALKALEESKYRDIPEFAYYRINLLIRLNRIEEAEDLATMDRFNAYEPVLALRDALMDLSIDLIKDINATKEVKESSVIAIPEVEEEKEKVEETSVLEDVTEENAVIAEVNEEELPPVQEKVEEHKIEDVKIDNKPEVTKPAEKNEIVEHSGGISRLLLTEVYAGVISLEELQAVDVAPFVKNILIICYYDKAGRKNGAGFIKSLKNQEKDENKKKIYSKLLERFNNKKIRFFDIGVYTSILKFNIDTEYAVELLKEQEEKELEQRRESEEFNRKIEEEARRKKEELQRQKEIEEDRLYRKKLAQKRAQEKAQFVHFMKQQQKRDDERRRALEEEAYDNSVEDENIEETQETSTIEQTSQMESVVSTQNQAETSNDTRILTIAEAFPNETKAIGAYFYYLMNLNKTEVYIKQYDRFDHLTHKPVNDISSLELFEVIVIKCSRSRDIKVKYEEKSFERYYKKKKVLKETTGQ